LNLSTINYSNLLQVGLKEEPTILQEIVVKGYTPIQLLRIAAKTTNDSSFSPVILHSYYREFVSKNGHYIKFADAAIDYYVKNDGKKREIKMKLLESRAKSKPFKIDSGMNDYDYPFAINAKNFPSASNLVWLVNGLFKNPNNYIFDFFETTNGTGETFVIVKFNPKPGVKKPLYEGSVIIAKESFLIQSISYELPEANKKYTKVRNSVFVRERVLYKKAYLKFMTFAGHSYLQYARLEGVIKLFDGRKTDVKNGFTSEMLVNSISFKDISAFNNEERYHKSSIYKSGDNYHSKFWEGQRSILATEDEEKIIQSLDKIE
jgi:hypothetical protein